MNCVHSITNSLGCFYYMTIGKLLNVPHLSALSVLLQCFKTMEFCGSLYVGKEGTSEHFAALKWYPRRVALSRGFSNTNDSMPNTSNVGQVGAQSHGQLCRDTMTLIQNPGQILDPVPAGLLTMKHTHPPGLNTLQLRSRAWSLLH